MKVLFLPEIREYLKELSYLLYEKHYFSFLDSAENYMEELIFNVETTLHVRQKRNAPPHFNKYGKDMYYSSFRKNKNTEWYVFFNVYQEQGETIYLVRFISNNHVSVQYL